MRPSTPRKPSWTLARWAEFGRQCQATRDRICRFRVPSTRGVKAPHIDAVLKIGQRMEAAMRFAENTLAAQHPETERNSQVLAYIHGNGCRPDPNTVPPRFDHPILSREQWATLGAELKAIDDAVRSLAIAIGGTAKAGKPGALKFFKVCDAISSAKCKLDGVVYTQHPEWEDFGRVFYGPNPPDLKRDRLKPQGDTAR